MIWHFVCLGPIDPLSGLMYDVPLVRFLVSSEGFQSDCSMSVISLSHGRRGVIINTLQFLIFTHEFLEPAGIEHQIIHLLWSRREGCGQCGLGKMFSFLPTSAFRLGVTFPDPAGYQSSISTRIGRCARSSSIARSG
jgi:hypothetical protein